MLVDLKELFVILDTLVSLVILEYLAYLKFLEFVAYMLVDLKVLIVSLEILEYLEYNFKVAFVNLHNLIDFNNLKVKKFLLNSKERFVNY